MNGFRGKVTSNVRTDARWAKQNHSYKIIYSGFCGHPGNARIGLILLVGAGRFERPTPCAQVG